MQNGECLLFTRLSVSSTLRDWVGTAELKIADSREHNLILRDLDGECMKELWHYLPVMVNMQHEGQLIPLKFDDCFYDLSELSSYKQLYLGATIFSKVNEQQ